MERPRQTCPLLTAWPIVPTQDFLPQPRGQHDLLAHWEWVLWNIYSKAYIDGGIHFIRTGQRSTWDKSWALLARTFWERLATSNELIQLCRQQPSLEVHRVLTWLFWYSDMVERKTIPGTFGFQHREAGDRTQQIKRAKKIADNLETARQLVARTPPDYFSPDEWKTMDQLFTKGLHLAQTRGGSGPSAIVLRLSAGSNDETLVLEPKAPAASTSHPGKPADTGGDLNFYLALLVDLIEAIPGQQKHEDLAMSLLHHFNPPRFQKTAKPFNRENLRLTVHTFKHKPGVTGRLRDMREWFSSEGVLAMCPCPDFITSKPSSLVVDRPR